MKYLLAATLLGMIAFFIGAMLNTIRVRDARYNECQSLLDCVLLYFKILASYTHLTSFHYAVGGIVTSQAISLLMYEMVSLDLAVWSVVVTAITILNLHYFADLVRGTFDAPTDSE